MERNTISDRELFLSIIPGWRLIQGLKDVIFKHQTQSKEFKAAIGSVMEKYGISNYYPEYAKPYFLMRVSEDEFRRLLVEHLPDEVIVENTNPFDEGTHGGFHFHATHNIVIVSHGYVWGHGPYGVLNDLPYEEVERRGSLTLSNWIKYVRIDP